MTYINPNTPNVAAVFPQLNSERDREAPRSNAEIHESNRTTRANERESFLDEQLRLWSRN
jgi:hypothetical protein